ncbi:MAG: PIN domain-containing protein [Reyranella sp.]|uniref:type II toxin-antitoxin system VapC family toxin n=1 Tax=Reyranella sp. TaxID=1929291 RepID=UPI0011FB8273|nr:type II toxin-antitoxin system VapC family toxin [Reyranella sp.]TAJ96377.1 MAG: PIN domain-containing protein [Reyranella sp.]TBR25199.1 MAG: PIN domain-containing protein [Reyranella sp.]
MTIVVDASIALKWVLEEPGSDAAEELLERDLAAPSLWLLEAGNALWRRTVRGELTQAEAGERLAELTKAPVASVPLEHDLPEAMRLALQLNHPVYDCLYLALAKRLGTYVVTADARFCQAVASHGTHIGHIRVLSPKIRGPGPRM